MTPTEQSRTENPAPAALPWGAASHSCGAWWTGASRTHCPAAGCHRTFSGESAADRHRVGRVGVDRRCVDPATVGLVPVDKPYGVLWSWPASDGWDPASHRDDPDAE